MERIKVLVLHSLSFSGTTLINTILSSHPRAFNLGAFTPDYLQRLKHHQPLPNCQICGANCTFWPEFSSFYYRSNKNLFLQIASFSSKKILIINNPAPSIASELNHPCIDVFRICIARDLRANAFSYSKNLNTSFEESVDWVKLHYTSLLSLWENPSYFSIRYEDFIKSPFFFLDKITQWLHIESYPSNATCYWEYDHHLLNGNASYIKTIRFIRGDIPSTSLPAHILELAKRQIASKGALSLDRRWILNLSPTDYDIFSSVAGKLNKQYGYSENTLSNNYTLLSLPTLLYSPTSSRLYKLFSNFYIRLVVNKIRCFYQKVSKAFRLKIHRIFFS